MKTFNRLQINCFGNLSSVFTGLSLGALRPFPAAKLFYVTITKTSVDVGGEYWEALSWMVQSVKFIHCWKWVAASLQGRCSELETQAPFCENFTDPICEISPAQVADILSN